MDNWKEVKLSDVTSILGDGIHGTPNYSDDGHYYFINGNNLCEGKIIFKQDTKRVSESEYLKYKKPLNNRTLLFSINGTVGNVAKYNGEPCILGKSACYFNIIEEVDKDYIYYVVSSPSFIQSMSSLANGTTIKNVSLKQMREKEFLLPPIETQRKISAMLSAIDKKIDINQRICRNIEEQAQAIFKSWFIDFEPFQNGKFVESELGMIPEGWKICKLGDVCEIVLGGTPSRDRKDFWNGDIAWINSGEVNNFRIVKPSEYITQLGFDNSATKLLPRKTTVIAITGATLGQISLLEIDSCANQSVVGIIENKLIGYEFIYPLIHTKIKELLQLQTGGAQQHINKGNVQDIRFIQPDRETMKNYSSVVRDMYELIGQKSCEIAVLTELRDTLLPKLMSGQITL
jgi:type I restriction enzyme S subunit